MSEPQRLDLAKSTCNVIAAVAPENASMRIKEINAARQKMGMNDYTGSDDEIRDSVKFGICENLVLNDPEYASLVATKKELVAAEKKRIDNIAAVSCSIMAETRVMDAALRVKELNEARVEIGEPPFVDGDEEIKRSFRYDLCEALVRNDPDYSNMIAKKQELEAETAAAKAKDNAERARQNAERLKVPQQNWRRAIMEDIGSFQPKITNINFLDSSSYPALVIKLHCDRIEGYEREVVVVLKRGLGTLRDADSIGGCYRASLVNIADHSFPVSQKVAEALSGSDPRALIESATLVITGVDSLDPPERFRKVSPESFPPLGKYDDLQSPIRINIPLN